MIEPTRAHWKERLALWLSETKLHPALARTHRLLDRYMDLARNWNNGDETRNGEQFLIRQAARYWKRVWDIGANVGRWTGFVLDANPACQIDAFEPAPETFAALEREVGHSKNVRLFPIGLGAGEARLPFYEYGEAVLSSFVSRETSMGLKPKNTVALSVTSADSFCERESVGAIDFVKIDTEGFEMAVLRGMRRSLAEGRISMIQFEYGGTWLDAGETLGAACRLLSDAQYKVFRLRRNGLEPIRYDCRKHECFKYSNFAAIQDLDKLQDWNLPVLS